ncbi:pentatricopeptide repeat-containing protein At1g08610-like [Hibiscus syriacus]|uniref:pentatricopeptide repeat-containing protein At1g08610-like n=1 Tax=Hibiscus syriacus TaxID=106335 RepID=UPI00192299A9|nr:pentatricopeptide repeat-containing protein At1g08610-like [Hibiscus syriacus]
MGFTVALHNSPVEICRFHGVQWGSTQLGLGCSSMKCSIVKVSTSHLAFSNKCSHGIHSCLPWKVDNGSEREAMNLIKMICLNSEDSNASAKRKFKEQINSKKLPNPLTSSLDGPFVRNEEETNNDILQKFCSSGKLNDATRLIEIRRQNQIPHFPSCINLTRGFVKVNELDKADKVLQIIIMSGGIPGNITYNMMVRGLFKRGRIRSAIDLLEKMSLCGCPPRCDYVQYNNPLHV